MTENEVIIVDGIAPEAYDLLCLDCIRYAIISKPFTIRRIENQTLHQAILNIFKGKLAETLFRYFCHKNNILINRETCTTPFWDIDRRDFIYNRAEWDIKNNFIFHEDEIMNLCNYTDLPALIPNRKPGDQWDSRLEIKNNNHCQSVGFVFTFLKGADLKDGIRSNEFCQLTISNEQLQLLARAEKKFGGYPAKEAPFKPERFWEEMEKRGNTHFIQLNYRPHLIITGYANSQQWSLFKNTGPGDSKNNFQSRISPRWYSKTPKGSVNFMNGTLWPTITNATAPVRELPSFLSLFPEIKNNLICGKFKV